MWLKHRNDVKWNDLPYIESAYFAQFEVGQALGNGRRIIGLERLLWEDVQFSRPLSSQEHEERKQRAWARLQERIKSHEVVLIVNQFRAPLAPLFRWKAEAGQLHGGRWEIQTPSHTSGHGGVERLLSEVQAPAPTSTGGGDGLKAAVADRAKAMDALRNLPLVAPPQPLPPSAKVVESTKEEQQFKLVELVEVVQRAKFGAVAGATAASKHADCPKVAERTYQDGDAFKQFINLDKDIDGHAQRHPEHERYIELRARIEWTSGDKSRSLAGKKVHWAYTLTPHSGAQRPAALDGEQNAGFGRANGTQTEIATTDKAGWTPIMKFYLSQYAGDRFSISAQADAQESGKPSGDTLSAGPYVVWRKFWYQMTHAEGKVIAAPADSVSAYTQVAADMLAADAVVYKKDDVADAKRTFYPQWMVSQLGGNDATDAVVIGGHNRDGFYGKFNAEKNHPVKGHLVICDSQWDPAGVSKRESFTMNARSQEVKFVLEKLPNAGILKPALQGNLVAYGKWKVDDPVGLDPAVYAGDKIKRSGDITDADIKIEAGRSGLKHVTVVLPADCPDPKKYPVIVELELNYGTFWGGESNVHQMLIVYRPGKDKEFNQTVSHEFGHGFGQTPRPTAATRLHLPRHPKQYSNEHGGKGPHCSTGATLGGPIPKVAPSGLYSGGTCIMFHQLNPAGCTQHFCADCDPFLRLEKMDALREPD